jgi:hypothetical protein
VIINKFTKKRRRIRIKTSQKYQQRFADIKKSSIFALFLTPKQE